MKIRQLYFICVVIMSVLHSKAEDKFPIIMDNSVIFRIYEPYAKEVVLKGTMLPPKRKIKTPAGVFGKQGEAEMNRLNDGWWEYKCQGLDSGLYNYIFEVDDAIQIDSLNSCQMREGNEYTSYFILGNGIGDDFLQHDVPHGTVKSVWYPSKLKDFSQRRMMVYLPSGYNKNVSKKYPVLYLLHGTGGDEESWCDCGRIAQIMDNLIAEKRCVPMIVVMPNGIANMSAAPGKDPINPNQQASSISVESMMGSIESVFMHDVVEYVDKHYRTIPNKHNRAIAGLSLGGLQTLYISLNNPNSFDYVALFSAQATNALNDNRIAGMFGLSEDWNNISSALPFLKKGKLGKKITSITSGVSQGYLEVYEGLDKKLKAFFLDSPALFYISLGREDFVKKLNDDLRAKLDKGGYKYSYIETDGGHTWDNWRKYIVDFLPRLFR